MSKYIYMNGFTGEIYTSLWHGIKTVIKDYIKYPKCRDLRMFHIIKNKGGF